MGISVDRSDRQEEFDNTNNLGFPLLSDPETKIARQFGVRRPRPLPTKRATFVIAQDRRLIAKISSETNMHTHADEALKALAADA